MTSDEQRLRLVLAGAVRAACLEAAREGYEQAAIAGLCHEGAVEASLDAIQMLDLEALLAGPDETRPKMPRSG
ncbi:MAG TPA: acetyltransferase [Gammaproteobacteria bacterium]|nr:acetyltransferase [Gammaproteobacteria bacterium]